MATIFGRSDQQRNTRYSQGGTTEVISQRLGWWERKIFPKSPMDVTLVITRKYAYRPDVMAYDMYGKATLAWFILQYNNISDINIDFAEGITIVLPTRDRLFGELLTRS